MAHNEPTFAARVTGEFGHSPVTFVASVLALFDVLYRIYELIRGQIEGPRIALPKVTAPPAQSAGQAALFLILFIFLTLLAQNLVSFVWYKFVTWLSRLPMLALTSLTFLLCGIISLITDYNMLTLTKNIAQLYQFGVKWEIQVVFAIATVISIPITLFMMIALVEEYNITHGVDIEWFAVINLLLYIVFTFFIGFLLSP